MYECVGRTWLLTRVRRRRTLYERERGNRSTGRPRSEIIVCRPAFFSHPQAGGNHKRVALWFVAGNARLSLITNSPRYARTVGFGADGGIRTRAYGLLWPIELPVLVTALRGSRTHILLLRCSIRCATSAYGLIRHKVQYVFALLNVRNWTRWLDLNQRPPDL